MNNARRIAASAGWMYGAQLATICLQFAYAAITSRTITPLGFGAYAVALSATALVGLLSNGGLAQTAARFLSLDRIVIRALLSYAVLLGLAGSAFLAFSATFWANLWGHADAAEPMRWLCISTFLAPSLGLASGLVRRLGRFKQLAIGTLIANAVGMAVGTICVISWQTPSSLLVSPILAQSLVLVGAFFLTDRLLFGLGRLSAATSEVKFSAQVVLTTMAAYLTGNVGKWSASVGLGAASLGQWNRADVVAFVPFQQIQGAIVQAVYPEFRHDRENASRARTVWPDLLGLVAWATMPITAVAVVLLPLVIPVLFGPGWEFAASLSIPIVIAGGLQTVSGMLSSGIEAIGRFKWIWVGQAILLTVSSVGAILSLILQSVIPLMIAPIVGIIFQHSVQVWLSSHYGYLNARVLARHYASATISSTTLAIVMWGLISFVDLTSASALGIGTVAFVTVALVLLLIRVRSSLPPIKLALKYGLIKIGNR